MYAIIRTGSKQYRVEPGTIIDVELVEGKPESTVEFKEVLLHCNEGKITVGEPLVKNCVVKGQMIDTVKAAKLVTLKYKRRKNSVRKHGHRQKYSRVKITSIEGGTSGS